MLKRLNIHCGGLSSCAPRPPRAAACASARMRSCGSMLLCSGFVMKPLKEPRRLGRIPRGARPARLPSGTAAVVDLGSSDAHALRCERVIQWQCLGHGASCSRSCSGRACARQDGGRAVTMLRGLTGRTAPAFSSRTPRIQRKVTEFHQLNNQKAAVCLCAFSQRRRRTAAAPAASCPGTARRSSRFGPPC